MVAQDFFIKPLRASRWGVVLTVVSTTSGDPTSVDSANSVSLRGCDGAFWKDAVVFSEQPTCCQQALAIESSGSTATERVK